MKRLLLAILFLVLTATSSFASFGGDLKANTAIDIKIGPFVAVGDGFSPVTDIGDPDVDNDLDGTDESYLIKHGAADGAAIQLNSGGQDLTWDQVDNMDGYYNLSLGTDETDTEGMLLIIIQDDSDCLPVSMHYMVMNEAAYNSKYGADDDGTGYMRVDGYEINDQSQTSNDNGADINTLITGVNVTTIESSDATDAIGDSVWDEVIVSAHDTSNTAGALLDSPADWATATSVAVSDKTGFSLSSAGNTAVIDEFETQSNTDPTGFKVNVMEVNGTSQTANDNAADINAILTDTGAVDTTTTMRTFLTGGDTAISTITTSDNIGINWGDVSNPTTTVGLTNTTVGIVTANSDLVTAAAVKTAMEAEGTSDLDAIADAIAHVDYGLSALRTQGDAAWVTSTGTSTLTTSDNIGINWADIDNKTSIVALTNTTISAGSNPSAATIADAVWDELSTGHVSTGKAGQQLWTDINAVLTDTGAVDTTSEMRTFLTGGNTALSTLTTSDNIGINWGDISNKTTTVALTSTTISASSNPTAATIADAVWDEDNSEHIGVSSTGLALSNASSAGDPWSTALPGAYGAGTAGKIIGDNIDAPISGISLASAATIADAVWDELQADHTTNATFGGLATYWTVARAGYLDELSAGNLPADIDSILYDTGTSGVQIDLSQTFEDSYSLAHYYRLSSAILFGLANGGGTTTITYKQLDGTNTRLVYTVDEVGNRSNVVRTLTE